MPTEAMKSDADVISVAVTPSKWVYDFGEGSRDMRELLGGKGANVAEMTRVLGERRVPPGFTITTEACVHFLRAGGAEPHGLAEQVAAALSRLEAVSGKRFGSEEDPLLISVRSGARESMPGMLDTVLNLGLNDASVQGLVTRSGDPRFAWDSYRRFVQMFGNVVRGIESQAFEGTLRSLRSELGAQSDAELDTEAMQRLTEAFKATYRELTGDEFPQDPQQQLSLSIRAVFASWTGKRAIAYRRINRIPDDWGTAVSVQQMVFGNRGAGSATGVAFSRDELTGAPEPSGEFLINAQGEDVVAGIRNTRPIAELADAMPEANAKLMEILRTLERHYGDMQDTEFTVEEGRLFMLQTRSAKRPAQAAVRFACDAVDEGLLSPAKALQTIDTGTLDALLHPTFDANVDFALLTTGVGASPGAAKGEVVFTAQDAVAAAKEHRDVILVRPYTEADDVAGFHAARGILTSEGGKASHAALVARGMGRPAVVGASQLEIDLHAEVVRVDGHEIGAGDRIAIDGTTGTVTLDDVPLVEARTDDRFERVLKWADGFKRLGVRANADTPEEADAARRFGAEGIGLCRTEHMFMAPDRQPKMRAMIMARTEESRTEALAELLPLQQQDFAGLFASMRGFPVTIRLLDPPLHEFLPHAEEIAAKLARARAEETDDIAELERLLEQIHSLTEVNPMLGTRGCRLAMVHPEIYEMQVRAIARAVRTCDQSPHPEIMIPLIAYETELQRMRALVVRTAADEGLREGDDYTVGTMIELPRACFVANRIAEHADFFSFGTNDLTQTALGLSRDDAEGGFLARYLEEQILDASPFETIDEPGVGWLVRLAAWVGRERKPDLKLGICGEHGGDPKSIDFFHNSGLDYVSCSPFRVPVARIAAAQAALEHEPGEGS